MNRLARAVTRPIRSIVQRRSIDVIRVRRVDLRRRGLDLGGMRIVVASDLHAREDWFPRTHVARVVDAINAIDGTDMVALLGDFVGDDVTAIDWSSEEYARIDAPVAAVLGNHDHWCDAAYIQQQLEDVANAQVLTNASLPMQRIVEHAPRNLWLTGIDSCWTRRDSTGPGADAVAAFAEVPGDAEAIVLGHEPHLAQLHEHVLHLAGHTHCGQVRTPILGNWTARVHMPRYSAPYPCWLYEEDVDALHSSMPAGRRTGMDRRYIYTTAGIGYSTVDFRAFCPPEIIVIDA